LTNLYPTIIITNIITIGVSNVIAIVKMQMSLSVYNHILNDEKSS